MINGLSSALTTAANAADPQKLKAAAQSFEAVFLRQMISSMRQADLGEGIFDSSSTEQFRDMADANVADDMAKKGGFGVTEMLMKQYNVKAAAAPAVDSAK